MTLHKIVCPEVGEHYRKGEPEGIGIPVRQQLGVIQHFSLSCSPFLSPTPSPSPVSVSLSLIRPLALSPRARSLSRSLSLAHARTLLLRASRIGKVTGRVNQKEVASLRDSSFASFSTSGSTVAGRVYQRIRFPEG